MNQSVESAAITSVLLIDDSSVQRAHGVRVCRELGIQTVHEAGNGAEALALLDTLVPPPALLIVDLEMPTMDGPELLAQLRQRDIDIPIILASSRERTLIHSVGHMGSVLGLRILGAAQKPLTSAALGAFLGKADRKAAPQSREAARFSIDAGELRAALERHEIIVHYQPQIEISTGAVRGVEALARWQHPTLGLIPPDRFIALAEQHDLIHPLTMQVMNQAMVQAVAWSAQDIDVSVAVNLSPLLLDRADLVSDIAGLQESYGLVASRVILEITESSLLRQLGVALGVLTRLRLRGFGLSLDDYGTGFSSMQQLARIPFTELKIDRSFVKSEYESDKRQVMLRSAVEMANELGLVTVAEGVESMQELLLLRACGCTLAQGWLFAKAMPGPEMAAWLREYAGRKGEWLHT